MTLLCDLCVKYGTDKGPRSMNGWDYSPKYFDTLNPVRNKVEKVLEIGICGYRDIPNNVVGASLFVWREFFPNAEIYGIDNDGKFIFNDQPRIHTAQADAYDGLQLDKALRELGNNAYDFIVDDAVHDPGPQLLLLDSLWLDLVPGGLYAMEDVCPYKMPNGSLDWFIKQFPEDSTTQVVETYKSERLLLIRKSVDC